MSQVNRAFEKHLGAIAARLSEGESQCNAIESGGAGDTTFSNR